MKKVIYDVKRNVLRADVTEMAGQLVVRGYMNDTEVIQRKYPKSQLTQAKAAADEYSKCGYLPACD